MSLDIQAGNPALTDELARYFLKAYKEVERGLTMALSDDLWRRMKRKIIKKNYRDLIGTMLLLRTGEVGMVAANIRSGELEYSWIRLRDDQSRSCFIIRHPSVVMDLDDETIEGIEITDSMAYMGNIQLALLSIKETYDSLKSK
jgi:hypothetical protein